MARECSRPLVFRFGKKEGHLITSCIELARKKKEGRLNTIGIISHPPQQGGTSSVLEGLIVFRNLPVKVLFDMGASHSFVLNELVDMLCIYYVCLVTSLRIANPVGGFVILSMLCKDVEIMFCNLVFIADL